MQMLDIMANMLSMPKARKAKEERVRKKKVVKRRERRKKIPARVSKKVVMTLSKKRVEKTTTSLRGAKVETRRTINLQRLPAMKARMTSRANLKVVRKKRVSPSLARTTAKVRTMARAKKKAIRTTWAHPTKEVAVTTAKK